MISLTVYPYSNREDCRVLIYQESPKSYSVERQDLVTKCFIFKNWVTTKKVICNMDHNDKVSVFVNKALSKIGIVAGRL